MMEKNRHYGEKVKNKIIQKWRCDGCLNDETFIVVLSTLCITIFKVLMIVY